MFEGCHCRVCDAGSLHSSSCLLSSLVCCLDRLLNVQLCRGFIFTINGAEAGGSGCFCSQDTKHSRNITSPDS